MKRYIPNSKEQLTVTRLRQFFKQNKQQLLDLTEVAKLPSLNGKRSDLVDFLIEHNACDNAAVFVTNDA